MDVLFCTGDMYESCHEPAKFIRHTQFAGSHPLCEKHAKEDREFMINNSYQVWERL